MDIQAWTYVIVTFTFIIYIAIAIWSKASTTSEFYVAGKSVSPLANGMATAADWMSAQRQGGRMVGTKLVKSDTMLIFMLKAARPEKYRDRHELTGAGGGPIKTEDLTKVPDAELKAQIAGLLGLARTK